MKYVAFTSWPEDIYNMFLGNVDNPRIHGGTSQNRHLDITYAHTNFKIKKVFPKR
jgi:hypothetical protein